VREARGGKAMREILFRGKRIYNGEWVYGLPNYGTGGCIDNIVIQGKKEEYALIYEETIGQFTGFCDKNGTKIFEGDILVIHYDDLYPEDTTKSTVAFHNGAWSLKDHYDMGWKGRGMEAFDAQRSEVIGNIYDKEDDNV
jgi:uncharacterized phage protein (TIGR01671 family)